MTTTYTAMRRLEPNKRVEIIERDERGNIVGTWFGYWSPRRQTVTLYPDKTHPFFKWSGTPAPRIVNDRSVRVKLPEKEKAPAEKRESEYYSSYAIKRMPVPGQITMKF